MHLRPWFIAGLLAVSAIAGAAPPNGARVLAQWGPDGLWYPAHVNSSEGSRITVNFDDGDVAAVNPSQVRSLDWQPGTRVSCNWHNKGKYYPGALASIAGDNIQIAYDDGDKEAATISRCRSK
jgi:hypothetical protein